MMLIRISNEPNVLKPYIDSVLTGEKYRENLNLFHLWLDQHQAVDKSRWS